MALQLNWSVAYSNVLYDKLQENLTTLDFSYSFSGFMKSFLPKKNFYVQVNEAKGGEGIPIIKGLPLGNIQSPLFVNLYVSELKISLSTFGLYTDFIVKRLAGSKWACHPTIILDFSKLFRTFLMKLGCPNTHSSRNLLLSEVPNQCQETPYTYLFTETPPQEMCLPFCQADHTPTNKNLVPNHMVQNIFAENNSKLDPNHTKIYTNERVNSGSMQ